MNDNFYKSFEDLHRGSRDSIGKRLEIYLPFITPLKEIHEDPLSVDLGCGRGEWLELVTNHGFKAKGIDLDENMLAECKKHSFDVECADAITTLNNLPDNSVSVLSAFHLIEHISFSQLKELVLASTRVLKDGGLLILETPNPENIIVSTVDFYIDPTHSRPIPPMLLEFLVMFCGFETYKILRLHGSQSLIETPSKVTLIDVLGGVSPNYAVIAQKKSSAVLQELFKEPFSKEYGTTLNLLAQNYDTKQDAKLQEHNAKLQEHNAKLQEHNAKLQELNAKFEALLNSKSWRYTAWLRKLFQLFR
ncbi:class I SAM-dependent methyltransferase [Sulfurimonas sp.]|jgi:O-antigen chain-terminating methyltransferase|uniref:class I SAM-dependent methyltransferase n=1 Tax=Sulfurimonas sp. TaxID=2022749 RepID=UPI002A358D4F|nr:class I SAM-dependent methyltransferase [Sulfurimonas sp.]MDY0122974.1 class I SAM-dependent methyltransferase [Sulfurimonas sp.]